MALYRNAAAEPLVVSHGLSSARTIEPDETFEVDEEFVENYDLNDNLVRVSNDGSGRVEDDD